MRKKISRITATQLAICTFLFLVTAILGYTLIRQSSRAIRSLLESRMLDVANTAAAMLDGDALETLDGDATTPEYQDAYQLLTRFESNTQLEDIYCVQALEDGSFAFLIDPDPEAPGAFGEPFTYTEALHQASLGTPSVDKVPYEDKWGRFYSAYSPVFDSDHQVAAIVSVDFRADWYENQIFSQVRTTLLISLLSLLFAGIVVSLVAARYRNQFHQLFHEMNQLSDRIETLVHELSPYLTLHLGRAPEAPTEDVVAELGDRILSLEHQLRQGIDRVRAQAYIDALTGLENRAAYEDYIAQQEERIRAGTAQFALAVFDLNGLKEINDRCGHEQGDRAITALSDALKAAFDGARLFRIGGDEFVVLYEEDADRLESGLEQVHQLLAQQGSVGVSQGHAVFVPGEDEAFQSVFNRADGAMYAAKREYYRTHPDRRMR